MPRGYFGIGIWNHSKDNNFGSLFRSAMAFNANYIFTIGNRYRRDQADTPNSKAHIPYFHFDDEEDFLKRKCGDVVCVELTNTAISLTKFSHPERACYLLGNETVGIPESLTTRFPTVIIPTRVCVNVAVAGSVVMFDRLSKIESK